MKLNTLNDPHFQELLKILHYYLYIIHVMIYKHQFLQVKHEDYYLIMKDVLELLNKYIITKFKIKINNKIKNKYYYYLLNYQLQVE